jgi:hypothetical protein
MSMYLTIACIRGRAGQLKERRGEVERASRNEGPKRERGTRGVNEEVKMGVGTQK